ncbi:MAG TPA: hypothetical protein VFV84_08625 [Burkholderiales bacterium]|nr:hypothetical protein [Burkholderiales bacterium]
MLVASPLPAMAQSKSDEVKLRSQVRSYRCVTKAGRKYYGSTIPPQCQGELVEALSAQGTVLFRIDPPLTPEQKAAKDAEEQKAAEADAARQEELRKAQVQARRDAALLQTYADETDIERVRQRALADNRAAANQVLQTIEQLKARQAKLSKETAKYTTSDMPATLLQETRAVSYDLTLQEQLLNRRNKEAADINARYDEEKRKYLELTGRAKKK